MKDYLTYSTFLRWSCENFEYHLEPSLFFSLLNLSISTTLRDYYNPIPKLVLNFSFFSILRSIIEISTSSFHVDTEWAFKMNYKVNWWYHYFAWSTWHVYIKMACISQTRACYTRSNNIWHYWWLKKILNMKISKFSFLFFQAEWYREAIVYGCGKNRTRFKYPTVRMSRVNLESSNGLLQKTRSNRFDSHWKMDAFQIGSRLYK